MVFVGILGLVGLFMKREVFCEVQSGWKIKKMLFQGAWFFTMLIGINLEGLIKLQYYYFMITLYTQSD